MVDVKPQHLIGYADQLHTNADSFGTIKTYVKSSCGKTDGMTGLLAPFAGTVTSSRDSYASMLQSAKSEMFQIHTNLKSAADSYRRKDDESAEAIFTQYSKSKPPANWRETDDSTHVGNFTNPFSVRLTPPPNVNEFAPKIREAKKQLGKLEQYANKVGFSLADHVVGPISGNWDVLKENAKGWEALASDSGVEVINRNITYGMDSLSSSWNGSAATQFDHNIRGRWIPALTAMRDVATFSQGHMELLAQGAITVFDLLIILLIEAVKWLGKKFAQLAKIIGTGFKAGAVVKEIVAFLLDVWGTIKHLLDLLANAVKLAAKYIEQLGREISLIRKVLIDKQLSPVLSG